MEELKNYAVMRFSNPILIDILGKRIPNTVMASLVSETGEFKMKFRIAGGELEPPKNCENVISLFFALAESNPESPLGKAYFEHRSEILLDTVLMLSQLIDGFTEVKILFHYTRVSKDDPEKEIVTETNFTLNRTKQQNI